MDHGRREIKSLDLFYTSFGNIGREETFSAQKRKEV